MFSHSVMSHSLQPHGQQHARLSCPSLSPGTCSNSCPLSQWCHPTFSFCLQSFPASRSFLMSQLFASGGQSIRASAKASFLPKNIQDWSPLGRTGLIILLSKGLSRVFSSNRVWKHQFPWRFCSFPISIFWPFWPFLNASDSTLTITHTRQYTCNFIYLQSRNIDMDLLYLM